MKKSFYILVLSALILSACSPSNSVKESSNNDSSNDSISEISSLDNSSDQPSSLDISSSEPLVSSSEAPSSDPLTPEELEVKEVVDKLANRPFAVSGSYDYVNSYIPDLNYPDNKVVQSESTQGQFVTVLTDEYYYLKEIKDSGYTSFVRYDHDEDGYVICKVLNPLTNEREDRFILNPIGQKYNFAETFGNVFKMKNAYKAFEIKDGNLVSKQLDDVELSHYFDFEELFGRLTNRLPTGDFNRVVISLDANKEPINLLIHYWKVGKYTTQEFIYHADFISEESAHVPAIPTAHEHRSEHEPLQAMFNNLHYNMNYTLTCNIDEGYQNTTFKVYVTKNAYYLDYGDEKDNSLSKGSYVEEGRGLVDFVKTDTGHKATGLPKTIRTVEQIFNPYWCYKAEMFSLDNDGYYCLSNEIGVYDNVPQIFVPDSIGYSFSYINESSFKMKLDNDTLLYQYDIIDVHVNVTIDHIDNTSLPFTIESIVPYEPVTTFEGFIQKINSTFQGEYWKRIGLLVNNNYNILPYVDTPYGHQGHIDCIGSSATGQLTYTINANFVFDFETTDELLDVTERYADILRNNPDYEYDYERDSFIYHHDEVYIEITFKHVENTGYAPYGLEYNIANLNEAPSLEW